MTFSHAVGILRKRAKKAARAKTRAKAYTVLTKAPCPVCKVAGKRWRPDMSGNFVNPCGVCQPDAEFEGKVLVAGPCKKAHIALTALGCLPTCDRKEALAAYNAALDEVLENVRKEKK